MRDLHVHRFGPDSGPLVLALHGLTGHGRRWAALATEYLSDLRIVAPDLPGHGRSTSLPPWTFETVVADLVPLLDGEPAVVVGHSFGGAVGIHLARRYPELVRALVLLDPAMGMDPAFMLEVAESVIAEPDYPDAAAARADKVGSGWAEVEPRLLDAELDEHLVPTPNGRVGWRMSTPAIASFWSELSRDVVVPPAGLPTVLVQAMKADIVTPALRAALTERLGPALTVHEFDCDHMVAQARPAETAAAIRAVL
ncbi:alpha/beta fold hydrolase [Nocardia terpenica]|uniref:Alpha/beta fold hydrolase n=1 Tax=Nocardia terpenica TaxID=455432 RepID=A0A6G9Z9R5_9NOCA|nr:alpha/beta fold hydrolase [Nocardia terpenica]QIS22335.1 alpha/beta fold hydrolase [Nocardia terpenica]